MEIQSTVTPTLTGVTADVQLEGAASAMQPLEAFGGGGLPALVPLTTWAEWNAAIVPSVSGFARNVQSHKSGSKIISVT